MRIIKEEDSTRNLTDEKLKENRRPSYTVIVELPKNVADLCLEYAHVYGRMLISDAQIGFALCSPHERFTKKKGRELAAGRMIPIEIEISSMEISRCNIHVDGEIILDFAGKTRLDITIDFDKKDKSVSFQIRESQRWLVSKIKTMLTSEDFKTMTMQKYMEEIMMAEMEQYDNIPSQP